MGRPDGAQAARALRDACIGMGNDVLAFVARRSVPQSDETPEDYSADIRAFAAKLGAHMEQERRGVIRLLTSLPPARILTPRPAASMRAPDRLRPAG